MKGRVPSAISNWITEGKISPAALQGEGVRAKIWVEQADADLARSLDPAQQAAQESPVAPSISPTGSQQLSTIDDENLTRRRAADADRAEQKAIASHRHNAIEDGRWVDNAAVRQEFGERLAKLISENETFVGMTLARALADRFGIDWKEASVFCRAEYRKMRAAGADRAVTERREHEETMAEAAE